MANFFAGCSLITFLCLGFNPYFFAGATLFFWIASFLAFVVEQTNAPY